MVSAAAGRRWPHERLVRAGVAGAITVALWTGTSLLARAYHGVRDARASRQASQGQLAIDRGTPALALRPLRDAVALQPGVAAHRLALARALEAMGRYDEAITYLATVVAEDPVGGEANLAMARALRATGQTGEAERSYYRAVYGQWPPGAEQARLQTRLELIDLLQDTADAARVRSELLHLSTAFPGDRALQLHIGQSLLALDYTADAARVFEDVLARFADPGPAQSWLAVTWFQGGDYAAAFAAATAALHADREDSTAARVRRRASAALTLDPTLSRLSVAERTRRWKRLIQRAGVVLPGCDGGTPRPETTQLMKFATTALSRRAAPDLAMNAGAAVARLVTRACPPPTAATSDATTTGDDALALVARRIVRQEPAS